ncbi:MAG: TetR/AcrR family transcriptional regulator [bacterium]
MQVKKNYIRKKILEEAKKLFLKKGFSKTSLRAIAEKSETSLSNLYNYFTSKDELFAEILNPVVEMTDFFMETISNISLPESMIIQKFEKERENIEKFIFLLVKNREMLRLLVKGSSGSRFENYRLRILDGYKKAWKNYLFLLKNRTGIVISDFTINNVCLFHINAVEDALKKDLSVENMRIYAEDILYFTYFGFESLVNYHKGKKS